MGEWIDSGASGHRAYLALPESRSGPGVLLLHAWWGLTPVFTDVCDRLEPINREFPRVLELCAQGGRFAQELKRLFAGDSFGGPRKSDQFLDDSKRFFVNYFKQVAQVFGAAWHGRKYSVKSSAALRAFIRVAPDVVKRLDQEHADRTDFRAIGRVIAPWGRRIGDSRFETEGLWKRTGSGVDQLAKELRLALQYPEGAAF